MAKSKTDARAAIGLKCSKCGKMTRRHTFRNTKNGDKLEYKKYCPECKSVQVFKETKIGK